MLAAIAFDPEIRGVLVVLTGFSVLMGSIFMIIATNTGARLSFLITASALFGWLFLLGSLWTIYGIGFVGRAPQWMAIDINYNRDAAIPDIEQIQYLPRSEALEDPQALVEKYPLLHAMMLGAETAEYKPATLTKVKTLTQPWIIASDEAIKSVADKAVKQGAAVIKAHPEVGTLLSGDTAELVSAVRSQSIEIRDVIQKPLGGWCLLTESDPRRGEAVASADAALIVHNAFGEPTDTSDYITKDVFFYGGKEPCDPVNEMSTVKRVLHRVGTIFEVKSPKLYAAVTVQKSVEVPPVAGQAPPPPAIQKGTSTVTVGMLRNLGNKRLIPAMVALFALCGFSIFTTMLHYRDKQAMAVRAAFGGKKS